MLCPDKIGRDSWDRGGQDSVVFCNSPQELGEEALTERIPKRKETERPHDEIIVVVVACVPGMARTQHAQVVDKAQGKKGKW